MRTLAERFQSALDEAGLSAAELSRRSGMSKPAISLILNDTTKSLDSVNLFRVSRELSVMPEWLATGKGARHLNQGHQVNEPSPEYGLPKNLKPEEFLSSLRSNLDRFSDEARQELIELALSAAAMNRSAKKSKK